VEPGRRRSGVHEARWVNLLGFALRPGYGMAVDDWRVSETWRTLQGKFAHGSAATRAEGWILWRRIGGGLAAGQQQAVAEPLLGPVRSLHRQLTTGKGGSDFSFASHDTAEVWRLLGSLELLPVETKIELGRMLLDILPKRKMEPARPAILWAIGRIAARAPLYGPLNTVVPAETVADWLPRLMDLQIDDPAKPLAMMQMARRTDDRYRDLPQKLRDQSLAWLDRYGAPAHFIELVRTGGRLDRDEQGLVFGDSLPKGLRLQQSEQRKQGVDIRWAGLAADARLQRAVHQTVGRTLVGQAKRMAKLVRDDRQQVDPIDRSGVEPARNKLLARLGRRVDEPAVTGGVDVEVDRVQPG
jgi:hypothetical protein